MTRATAPAGRTPSQSDWLHAISHPCRLQILRHFLTTETATPSGIAEALALPLGSVSYHVRLLATRGILRLAGRTQRRGAAVHHYQLADRERTVSFLWGLNATLLATDDECSPGRGDAGLPGMAGLDEHPYLQAMLLDHLVRSFPGKLSLHELIVATTDTDRPVDPDRVAIAVRHLSQAGAIHRTGDYVWASRTAVYVTNLPDA